MKIRAQRTSELDVRPQASACENSMKKCSYCGTEYPDDLVVCPVDQTPFEKDYQPIVETESKRRPVTDENRKRIQELRRIGFQKLLAGIVLLFAVGVLWFIFLDEDAGLHSHSYSGGSYSRGRGLGILLLFPVFGLWNIVRGVIYLIRAQSGDEHYAKSVEDTNSYTITGVETAEIISFKANDDGSAGLYIQKDGTIFNRFASAESSLGGKGTVIQGPATFTLIACCTKPTYLTLKIMPESYDPNKTLIIPPGTNQVQITLQVSSNLINWETATNNIYGSPNTAQFFRIKEDNLSPP